MRLLGSVAAAMVVMIGVNCDGSSSSSSDEGWTPNESDRILYELAWSWDGAEDGTFTTDLGYVVTLEAVHVGTVSAVLVPCTDDESDGASALAWLGPSAARADHGYEADDSLVFVPTAEDAFGAARELGVGTASGHTYCQLHWAASAMHGFADDGFDLAGSISIRGRYVNAEGAEREIDALETLGAGALRDLSITETIGAKRTIMAADGEPVAARVRITRNPAQALDGVDLDALTDDEIAYAFLQGACASAEVTVEVSST